MVGMGHKEEASEEYFDGGALALDGAEEQACHQSYDPHIWGSLAGLWYTA